MKTVTELTDQEILALTQEEMELMVKLRMAEEGIKILPQPEPPKYFDIAPKDDFGYVIGGFNFIVRDKEVASEVSDLLFKLKTKLYKDTYNGDYNNHFLKAYNSEDYEFRGLGEVTKTEYFTRETVLSIQESVKANAELKKEYEADLKDYGQNFDEAEWIREEIFGKYAEVNRKYYELDRMRERYNEYLSLSNQDSAVALKFLKHAYSVDKETEDYVLGNPVKVEVPKEKTVAKKAAKVPESESEDLPF